MLADYLSQSRHAIPFRLTADGAVIQRGSLDAARFVQQALVSCLMVTRGRLFPGRFAVECFLRQTYPNRELVIVCDGPGTEIEAHCKSLDDPRIRIVYADAPQASLGALRNLSLRAAQGEWVCQWDDDDLYHPERISLSMAVCQSMQSEALFLNRWLLWCPARRRIGISRARTWEGSMLARRERVPSYPALARGEDTAVMEAIVQSSRVSLIDAPWLYAYIQTGANTWGTAHFEANWKVASLVEAESGYDAALDACAASGPFHAYAQEIALRAGSFS